MTQLQILKEAFDRGERLTVADALTRYGIYALSQRCGELSKVYALDSKTVRTPSGKHVKEYFKFRTNYG